MGALLRSYLRWENLNFWVGAAVHAEGRENQSHRHDDFLELVFVHTGSALHRIGEVETPVHSGQIFLIPECCEHEYKAPRGMRIYNILFTRDFLRHFSSDLQGLANYQLLFHLGGAQERCVLELENRYFPEVVAILDEVIREEKGDLPGARTAVLANLLRAFLFFFRHAHPCGETRDSAGSHASRISRLLAALEARYSEDWTLERMAAFVRMSTVNFRLEFKRLTGSSPISRLLEIRLKKASHLLLLPEKSIAEVAALAGFRDSNYFARQFRRRYALTPREYRAGAGAEA